MRRLLLIILCSVFSFCAAAQTVSQIKSSSAYLWAEGVGGTKSQADAAALDALAARLAATDILDIEHSRRLAVWKTYLPDLKECSREIDISPNTSFRYIAWDDIPLIFSDRWRKVRELTESSEKALSRGAEDEARTYCHWAEIYLGVLPRGEASLRGHVTELSRRLGDGNTSAVKMRNIESETAAISAALNSPKAGTTVQKHTEPRPASQNVPAADPIRDQILIPDREPIDTLHWELPYSVAVNTSQPPIKTSSAPSVQPYRKQDSRWKAFAQAEFGRAPAFGLQVACTPGRVGGYVSARSNFNFTIPSYLCLSDGTTDFGYIWSSGAARAQRYAGSAGIVLVLSDIMAVYIGAGYGRERLLWEDSSGLWACVTDLSYNGVLAETGMMFTIHRLCLSAGVSTIAFSQACAQIGIGLSF